MKKKDPSSTMEPMRTSEKQIEYRIELEKYFNRSIGSVFDKLDNFNPIDYLTQLGKAYKEHINPSLLKEPALDRWLEKWNSEGEYHFDEYHFETNIIKLLKY